MATPRRKSRRQPRRLLVLQSPTLKRPLSQRCAPAFAPPPSTLLVGHALRRPVPTQDQIARAVVPRHRLVCPPVLWNGVARSLAGKVGTGGKRLPVPVVNPATPVAVNHLPRRSAKPGRRLTTGREPDGLFDGLRAKGWRRPVPSTGQDQQTDTAERRRSPQGWRLQPPLGHVRGRVFRQPVPLQVNLHAARVVPTHRTAQPQTPASQSVWSGRLRRGTFFWPNVPPRLPPPPRTARPPQVDCRPLGGRSARRPTPGMPDHVWYLARHAAGARAQAISQPWPGCSRRGYVQGIGQVPGQVVPRHRTYTPPGVLPWAGQARRAAAPKGITSEPTPVVLRHRGCTPVAPHVTLLAGRSRRAGLPIFELSAAPRRLALGVRAWANRPWPGRTTRTPVPLQGLSAYPIRLRHTAQRDPAPLPPLAGHTLRRHVPDTGLTAIPIAPRHRTVRHAEFPEPSLRGRWRRGKTYRTGNVVPGPYEVCAGQVYVAGAVAGQVAMC